MFAVPVKIWRRMHDCAAATDSSGLLQTPVRDA
jgi:hypothetical protein